MGPCLKALKKDINMIWFSPALPLGERVSSILPQGKGVYDDGWITQRGGHGRGFPTISLRGRVLTMINHRK